MADNVIPFVPEVQQLIDRVLDEARREDRGAESAEEAGRRRVERELADKIRRAKVRFTRELNALYAFMTDPHAPARGKAVAIGALLYFILPIDLVPDLIPIVGFVDDAAVIASAVAYLDTQLAGYRGRVRHRPGGRRPRY